MADLKKFKVNQGLEVNGVITANVIDATLAGAALDSPTFTGTVTVPSLSVGQGGFTAPNFGDVTSDEIQQLDGVTSNIQQQLDGKATVSQLTSHENDTTNVHGIPDTSKLATTTYVDNAVANAGGGSGGGSGIDYTELPIVNPLIKIEDFSFYINPSELQDWQMGTRLYSDGNTELHKSMKKLAIYNGFYPGSSGMIDIYISGLNSVTIPNGLHNVQINYSINGSVSLFFSAMFSPGATGYMGGYSNQAIISVTAGEVYPGNPTFSSRVSSLELKALDGVTSSIQTQLDSKASIAYVDQEIAAVVSGAVDFSPYVTKENPTFTSSQLVQKFYLNQDYGSIAVFAGGSHVTVIFYQTSQLINDLFANNSFAGYTLNATEGLPGLPGKKYTIAESHGKFEGPQDGWNYQNVWCRIDLGGTPFNYAGLQNSSVQVFQIDTPTKTISTQEILYIDGVTSNIQTQLDSKASLAYVDNAIANSGGGSSGDLSNYVTKNNPIFNVKPFTERNSSNSTLTFDSVAGNHIFLDGVASDGIYYMSMSQDMNNPDYMEFIYPNYSYVRPVYYDTAVNRLIILDGTSVFPMLYMSAKGTTLFQADQSLLKYYVQDGYGEFQVTEREVGYLNGLTSNIQTQLDSKPSSSDLAIAAQNAVSNVGTWQSWTPTLSIPYDSYNFGSQGGISGRYTRIGNTVHFNINLTFYGSGASAGSLGNSWEFSLPTAMVDIESFDLSGTIRYGQAYRRIEFGVGNSSESGSTSFRAFTDSNGPLSHNSPQLMNVSNSYVIIKMNGTYECQP